MTLRRWRNFGLSGAKLIWGGEAAAVCADGRANPNQTLAVPENQTGLAQLRTTLVKAHQEVFGATDDLQSILAASIVTGFNENSTGIDNLSFTVIPEPTSGFLFIIGLGAVVARRHQRCQGYS